MGSPMEIMRVPKIPATNEAEEKWKIEYNKTLWS